LNRVNAGAWLGLTNDLSDTTLGSWHFEGRAVDRVIVVGDDIDAVEEHRL